MDFDPIGYLRLHEALDMLGTSIIAGWDGSETKDEVLKEIYHKESALDIEIAELRIRHMELAREIDLRSINALKDSQDIFDMSEDDFEKLKTLSREQIQELIDILDGRDISRERFFECLLIFRRYAHAGRLSVCAFPDGEPRPVRRGVWGGNAGRVIGFCGRVAPRDLERQARLWPLWQRVQWRNLPVYVEEDDLRKLIVDIPREAPNSSDPKPTGTAGAERRAVKALYAIADKDGRRRLHTKEQYLSLVVGETGEKIGVNAWARVWAVVTKTEGYEGISGRGPVSAVATE